MMVVFGGGGASFVRGGTRLLLAVALGFCLGIALGLVVVPPLFHGDDYGGSCLQITNDLLYPRGSQQQQPRRLGDTLDLPRPPQLLQPAAAAAAPAPPRLRKPHKIVRPRYYASELGIKQKLFVGILSNHSTIRSFGIAINKTACSHIDQLVFFVDSLNNLPKLDAMKVVGFENSLPRLKPFHVLKHIGDNFAKDYDYFFLATDTTYVQALSLRELVDQISTATSVYMGAKVEGQLYCSTAAGFILSRSLLHLVLQHLDWCSRNALSEDIDNSIGRCITSSIGIPCTQRILQGQEYYSHKMDDGIESQLQLEELINLPHFNKSVSISHLSDATDVYKLHHLFAEVELEKVKGFVNRIRTFVLEAMEKESRKYDLSWPLGFSSATNVDNRFDLVQWQYFTTRDLYMVSDFRNVKNISLIDLRDIMEVVNETIRYVGRKHRKSGYEFQHLLNGYRRFDPLRGLEYLVDLTFRDKHSGFQVHKRLQAIRPLSRVEIVPIPYVTENTRVTLLLLVDFANYKNAKEFLKNYAKVCLQNRDNTALILVFIYNNQTTLPNHDMYESVKLLARTYSKKYPQRGTNLYSITIKTKSTYSSQVGILDLVAKRFPLDTLFVICSPEMDLNGEFLNRVRMNTIKGWQVFSPIPFVQYDPKIVYKDKPVPSTMELSKNYGHFDEHNYNYLSFYGSDYIEGRKLVQAEIPVTKSESNINNTFWLSFLNVHQMFFRLQQIHVLRAPEPGLLVRYVFQKCQSVLDNASYQECSQSRTEGLASRMHLANFIFEQDL